MLRQTKKRIFKAKIKLTKQVFIYISSRNADFVFFKFRRRVFFKFEKTSVAKEGL
jgi:hypothetical protein